MKPVNVWLGIHIKVPWTVLGLEDCGGDHLTLRYYGRMPRTDAHDALLPDLFGTVCELQSRRPSGDPLAIELTGLGTLWHAPTASVVATPVLLVRDCQNDLAALRAGMPPAPAEAAGYVPHISLTKLPITALPCGPLRVTVPWCQVFLSVDKERIYVA